MSKLHQILTEGWRCTSFIKLMLPGERTDFFFIFSKWLCAVNFKRFNGIFKNSVLSLQAARKFVDGKKTMAASGRLQNTPFVDEV